MQKTEIREKLHQAMFRSFGCAPEEASTRQLYDAVCTVLRDMLAEKRQHFHRQLQADGKKQVYYMSMEFLVGTSLRNNLFNLGLEADFREILAEYKTDIRTLYALDPDAGLGNGGLGRLASCYMDAMTGLGIPATGFSIRYEFGIFRQKIVDGWQMEFPDNWLDLGDVWLIPRKDETYEVRFGGIVEERFDEGQFSFTHRDYQTIIAVPYDMYISGYDCNAVNKLVLWSAQSLNRLDMNAFSRGDYAKALEQDTMAEVISKVLYPADDHLDGKRLRLRQQYLLVSASLQSILAHHLRSYASLDSLPDHVAIHINDTHPALCVPELMRLLLDVHHYGWEEAWSLTCRTLSYTNHTVMSEALEHWSESLFSEQLPRIYAITVEINRRLLTRLYAAYPGDQAKIDYMAVIANGEIRMANLCLAACHTINGVSKLHSQILQRSLFHDYYHLSPERFTNVTNGIAYRRWLCQANPRLSSLLCDTIGDAFLRDSTALCDLLRYRDDDRILQELQAIKLENKQDLASYIEKANGVRVDPNSLFDVQIKRLHEYKRQLLNVLQILHMYCTLKDNPTAPFQERTFIFAAKASAGYVMAKQIIRLIVSVSNLVNHDPDTRDRLRVVFLEDYRVSLAERIIPAAEISEQISIAGKEASGTGNMKLMINGAVTIGTLDGANVEIYEQVGAENMFLFGLRAEEVETLWKKGYHPKEYAADPRIARVLAMLTDGSLGNRFDDIVHSLLSGSYGAADAYMTLADFSDYVRAQREVSLSYRDRRHFTQMSLCNIAHAGVFSADRAVREYADKIWHIR